MLNTCIILSGGLGTRLRSAVPDLPKSMAAVCGKPFLWFVVRNLLRQGISHFVFALGYKSDAILSYLHSDMSPLAGTDATFEVSVERVPLGTGGAISKAVKLLSQKYVVVTNGDTFFDVRLQDLYSLASARHAEAVLALKHMSDFDRYGTVTLNESQQIQSFQEKKYYKEGLINGGMYLLDLERFNEQQFPDTYSFEKEYLEKNYANGHMYGCIQNGYFIDIGIPEDYHRAQTDLQPFI